MDQDPRVAFQDRLTALHREAGAPKGPRLAADAERAGLTMPTSTSWRLLNDSQLPRWDRVEAFVRACLYHAETRRPPAEVPAELRDMDNWLDWYEQAKQSPNPRPHEPDRAPRRRRPRVTITGCSGVINANKMNDVRIDLTVNYPDQ